jgi:hypothetical protein
MVFGLTGGRVADCPVAKLLLELLPSAGVLEATRADDTDLIRRRLDASKRESSFEDLDWFD